MLISDRTGETARHLIEFPYQTGLGRSRSRLLDMNKLPAKLLRCKNCDGKTCVGRCRFEKPN